MRSGLREWRRRLLLVVVASGLTLAVGEAVVRAVLPGEAPLFVDIYRLDERGLLELKPSTTRRHFAREWDVTISIGAEGLRDRDVPVPDDGGTVLALGDSFAFGWGVELEETFLYRVEEELRPQAVRIVKAGIPGTGTADQLEWLQAHGDRYAPEVVLLAFFVGNDFVDVQMGGTRGQFTVDDGLLVRHSVDANRGSALATARQAILRSSLLAQMFAQAVMSLQRDRSPARDRSNPGLAARDRWLWEFTKIHLAQPPPETERAVADTLGHLDRIHGWCRERGAQMVLLVIPRSFQLYDWELRQWIGSFGLTRDQLDLDRPQRTLSAWGSARQVAVVDLNLAFRNHVRLNPEERLYFFPNGHMNADGNRVAAEALPGPLRAALISASSAAPGS